MSDDEAAVRRRRRHRRRSRGWLAAMLAAGLVVTGCTGGHRGAPHPSGAPTTVGPSPSASTPVPPARGTPVFAIYYLWWDHQHWVSRLGNAYPYDTEPSPLPATLSADGCGTVAKYRGDAVTDVSQGLTYDQSNPQTISRDVALAADAGVRGFVVNWIGTGQPTQGRTSNNFNIRLAAMFDAVHKLNAAGRPFSLIFNYQSSAKKLSMSQFSNDFKYLLDTYGTDPALDHTYSAKPEIVMAGTWKYSDDELASISKQFRSRFYLIGDEKPDSWDHARAEYLDGTSYYWSSQNPIKNPVSFSRLAAFAATVRATANPDGKRKTWLAPFTPGYNATLLYHTPTCVPRNNGQTMRSLYAGNAASKPDGWTLISWNEISEGSYVVPLTRYGMTYVDVLKSIIQRGN
jgi:hypothetical protein